MTKKQLLRKLILKELKALTETPEGIMFKYRDTQAQAKPEELIAFLKDRIDDNDLAADFLIAAGDTFKPWIETVFAPKVFAGADPGKASPIIAAMDPGKAAAILNDMDVEKSTPIIAAMEAIQAAPILESMKPEKAAKIIDKGIGEAGQPSPTRKKFAQIIRNLNVEKRAKIIDNSNNQRLKKIVDNSKSDEEPEQKKKNVSKAMLLIMSRNSSKTLKELDSNINFINKTIKRIEAGEDDEAKKKKLTGLKKEAFFLKKKIKLYSDIIVKFYKSEAIMVNQKYKKKGFLGTRDKTRKVPMLKANIYIDVSKHLGEYLKQEEGFKEDISVLMDTVGEEEILSFPESDEQTYGKVYFQEIKGVLQSLQEDTVDPKVFLRDYRSTFREDAKSFEKRIDKVVAVLTGKEEEPEQETEVSERAIKDNTLNVVKSKLQPFAKNLLSEPSIFQTDELGELSAGTSVMNQELKDSFQSLQKIYSTNDATQTAQSFYPFLQAASTNKLTKKKIYELVEKIQGFEAVEDEEDLQRNTGDAIKKIVQAIKEASEKKKEILKDKSNVYLKFTSIATPLVEFFDVGVPLFKVVRGELGGEDEFNIHPVYADGLKDNNPPFTSENKEYIQILKRKNAEEIKEKFKPMDKDKLNEILETLETITENRNKEMKRDIKNLENQFDGKSTGAYRDIKRKIKDFEQRYDLLEGKPRNYNPSDYKKILNKFKEIFDATRGTRIDPKTFTDNRISESRIRELIKPYLKQKLKNKRRIS